MRPLVYLLLAGITWCWTPTLNAQIQPPAGSPFARAKVWLSAEAMRTLPSTGDLITKGLSVSQTPVDWLVTLPSSLAHPELSLDVIVHTRCLRDSAQRTQSLFHQVVRELAAQYQDLPLATVNLALPLTSTWSELNREAENDPCVYAVTSSAMIERNSFPDDPEISTQLQHDIMESKAGWEFFYRSPQAIQTETVVGVLDTGVDYNHKDLAKVIWRDTAGQLPPDYADKDSDPFDIEFHGTHIAGLIGAELNNGVGVAGVAGGHTKIMAVKIFGRLTGYLGDLLNGVEYAIENGAEVINLSLGSWQPIPALTDAILRANERGIFVVVSTGNDSINLDARAKRGEHYSPASFAPDIDGLISVASSDSDSGLLSEFSNYGQTIAEIAAPGNVGVFSTFPYDSYMPGIGTSMSAPLVAGAAALVIGTLKTHGLPSDPATVESLIKKGSVSLVGLKYQVAAGAHLNLRALAEVLQAHLEANGVRR